MPGEERTSIAAGKREIRFFFDEDREQAEGLKKELNDVLLVMGLKADVSVADFTSFQGAKPRRKTLELWLEPVPL